MKIDLSRSCLDQNQSIQIISRSYPICPDHVQIITDMPRLEPICMSKSKSTCLYKNPYLQIITDNANHVQIITLVFRSKSICADQNPYVQIKTYISRSEQICTYHDQIKTHMSKLELTIQIIINRYVHNISRAEPIFLNHVQTRTHMFR